MGEKEYLRKRGEVKEPQRSTENSVRSLVNQAKEDSLGRIPLNPEAQKRVENAIEKRFYPYVIEGAVIAEQLVSPEYREFVKETNEYLGAKVGFIACPDGRILVIQLGDPKVASFYRRLQGLPPIRTSTRGDHKMVPDDPFLSAAIATDIQERKPQTEVPKIVQFIGPHIHSVHPDHGCGDRTGEMVGMGHTPEIGMAHVGIEEYFQKLGDGFYAFDNAAENAGGRGSTFDLTHDAYSQGFIIGLRKTYEMFNPNLSLRENLKLLADNKLILMTELLDSLFSERITEEAQKEKVSGIIDMRDFYNFGPNAILIGKIAREITKEEEKKGYLWIPRAIREDRTNTALRALAYHCVRNVVYRTLGGIKPGAHALEEHPEKLSRVGPIGADFNVSNIPFIESTVPGPLQPSDIEAVVKLYNLSYGILRAQGVKLKDEARIILVTGIYDPNIYIDQREAQKQLNLATDIVRNNAAQIRKKFEKSIITGETVVIGALHEPGTRRLTHIV